LPALRARGHVLAVLQNGGRSSRANSQQAQQGGEG
jgi:hypothetical protein